MKYLQQKISYLNNLPHEDLKAYCYDNFDAEGLFLFDFLNKKYFQTEDLNLAYIIVEFMVGFAGHWEGADIFELNFYELVLNKYPDNIVFLECILAFGLPPYNEEMKKLFNFKRYYVKLEEIDSQNHIFLKVKDLI